MLQSVEIPNVVSIRASRDYHPDKDNSPEDEQWDIGMSSIWVVPF